MPGKSCVTQLLETVDEITNAIELSYEADIIYLDVSKNFDKIPYKRLLKKLLTYGIRGKVYEIFCLNNRTQRVGVNGSYSKAVAQNSINLPVGSPRAVSWGLSYPPSLSITYLYIFVVRLYADNSKLLGRVKALEHIEHVQTSLNNSVVWAGLWNMFFNFKNCHHCIMETSFQTLNTQWKHQMVLLQSHKWTLRRI